MAESIFTLNLLGESRKRMVGSLMGFIEKESWYSTLSIEERDSLRQKVLTSVGAYHDTCRDIIKASLGLESGVVNEYALEAIANMHRELQEFRRDFEDVYEV